MKTLLVYFSLSLTGLAFGADELKTLFVNNGESVYIDGKGNMAINPYKIKMAETNRECWPAKDFPEGNWGEMEHGCQMSLRFDRQIYTNGELIKTVVLVRNVTNGENYFINFHHSNKNIPSSINYSVYTESNFTITAKPLPGMTPGSIGTMSTSVGFSPHPHTQHKFNDCLNGAFDLTNGFYFVQASVSGYRQRLDTNKLASISGVNLPQAIGELECFELKSAKVPIEIR